MEAKCMNFTLQNGKFDVTAMNKFFQSVTIGIWQGCGVVVGHEHAGYTVFLELNNYLNDLLLHFQWREQQ